MSDCLSDLRAAGATLGIRVAGYTALILGIARTVPPGAANASRVTDADGTVIGSRLIAQPFTAPGHVWPRPSAVAYDAAGAGGSNLLPAKPALAVRAEDLIAAPGVGQTYEMLLEGAETPATGADVVIGPVETLGRKGTGALIAPLRIVPRREIVHEGQTLTEMDLDAVLDRRPGIVLVDKLAHTNALEGRHPERWQDIQEQRAAGIDGMTTVNIQHVESLNGVVGSFTRVRVRETVPDNVFEQAEIELVGLPPEDLIGRLEAGKV